MEHRSLSPDFIVSNDDHVGGNKCTREPSPNVASAQLLKRGEVECPVNCSDSELCTFLQALEEGFLPTYYSDTSQSAQSRSMSIASKSYLRGKKTVVFHGFQSLQMFRSSTGQGGEDSSIASAEGFPVRTSALQETAQESTANAAECGTTWRESLGKYDPDSHSLKTAQLSLLADSMSSSPILPRSGSMRSGRLYQRPRLVLRTEESASGYWQTPVADDAVNRIKGKINSRGEPKLSAQVLWRTPTVGMLNADRAKDPEYANRKRAKGQTITLADQVKWPTPRARDGQPEGLQSGMDRMGKYATCSLPTAVALFPTPTVCGNYNRKGASATSGDGLATAVFNCATPTARDWKSGKASQATMERNSRPLSEQVGGSLNPAWVCWLMNWPLNWFDGVKK